MDEPNPDHLKAYFSADLPAVGLPERFGIVTAYDAGSRPSPANLNATMDAELAALLRGRGLVHFRVTGRSRDGSHQEPGYGIAAESPEEIRPISRRFRQEAFFWVQDGTVYVINTGGTRLHLVGTWTERLAGRD
jgi:hypothetical protein